MGGIVLRNVIFVVLTAVGILFLSACGSAKDLTDYVDVSFTGMDGQGTADYDVDEEKLYKEIFDYDDETDFADEETEEEMENMEDTYKIKLDNDKNLSNGDKVKVTVSVNEDKTDKIKGGEKEVTVKGLDKPKKLTTQDVEEHLVVNFSGVSGRGTSKIDNTFDSPLSDIDFSIKNDGELKNGDKAKVMLDEDGEKKLNDAGYILDKDFEPTFEVEGLDMIAEKAEDIKNLKDIERMIEERAKRRYQDLDPDKKWGHYYKITREKLMYRQFDNDDEKTDDDSTPSLSRESNDSSENGNLIGIYTVKKYTGEEKLEDEFTAIIGYSDIILDDKNEANVAEINEISDEKDDTYSLESVIKLYEGYGYTEAKE